MDINGISVLREHGGTTVTLSVFFPKQEELDGSEFARLIDLVKDGAPSFTGGASPAGAQADEGPTRARGRRGAAAADAAPSSATASSSTDAGAAAPEQGTRRRRGAATEENPTAGATAAEQPSGGRRSRSAPAAETASPSESGRRSRRAAEPEAPKGITDLDLSKAASDAAAIITPAVVTKILEEKGVSRTNDLKGDDRQWFLDELAFEIAEAKKG